MTNDLIDKTVTGAEEYPGEILPRFYDSRLGDNVIKFLLAFYERVYGNGGLTFHSEETARSDDIAPPDRRQGLRRSGLDRRDPNGRHIRVPDRRKNGDRRITGRRKEDPK